MHFKTFVTRTFIQFLELLLLLLQFFFKETYSRVQVDVAKVSWTFSALFSIVPIVHSPPKSRPSKKEIKMRHERPRNDQKAFKISFSLLVMMKTYSIKHFFQEFVSVLFVIWRRYAHRIQQNRRFEFKIFVVFEGIEVSEVSSFAWNSEWNKHQETSDAQGLHPSEVLA